MVRGLEVADEGVLEVLFFFLLDRGCQIEAFLAVEGLVHAADDGGVDFMGVLLLQVYQASP